MESITPISSEAACREIISQWSQLSELADFAERRHGYGNSDGGFGITYPGDLDEYEIEVEGIKIPNGSVLLYGYAFAARIRAFSFGARLFNCLSSYFSRTKFARRSQKSTSAHAKNRAVLNGNCLAFSPNKRSKSFASLTGTG